MKYKIGNREFNKKSEISAACQKISRSTQPGLEVDAGDLSFLFELFSYNDTWEEKVSNPVLGLTTMIAEQGTKCFALMHADQSMSDISYSSSIRNVPTGRKMLPQSLLDYRGAARSAIQSQIRFFRDRVLSSISKCPITEAPITRKNCAVDHVPPLTFDRILYEFTSSHKIDPLKVVVDSKNGTVPVFDDDDLRSNWELYHQEHARLRLTSKLGNLQLPKPKVHWAELFQNDY